MASSNTDDETSDSDPFIKNKNEFNEDLKSIKNILNLNQKFIDIRNITCSAGSSSGDNYMSVVKRIQVIGVNEENKETVISLIIKRQIPSLSRRQLYRCDEAFNNEINAYLHVVPLFEKIINESIFPKCHFAGTDENGEIIILEDLKQSGFQMSDRLSGLDFIHCKLVMEKLAQLHAASVCAQHINNQLFSEKLQYIKEIVYCAEAKDFYRSVLETSVCEALNSLKSSNRNDGSLTEPIRLIEDLKTKLFSIISNCISEALPTTATVKSNTPLLLGNTENNLAKVICHGDMWINNIMFKINEFGKPCEVKFIDLQAMRYALPVFDILHFIYTSTKRNFRDSHLDELLEIYCISLTSNLHSNFKANLKYCDADVTLKSIKKNFSKENIIKLFYANILYGLAISMWVTPAVTFDPNNIPNLDNITELESINKELNMTQKLTPEYHSRMKDIALEFYQNGYLKPSHQQQ